MIVNIISSSNQNISTKQSALSVVRYGEKNFEILWQQFLDNYPMYSHRYTTEFINYRRMMFGDSVQDYSFVICGKGDLPLAICQFLVVEENGFKIACYPGSEYLAHPIFYPGLGEKQRRNLENYIYDFVCELLVKHNVKCWMVEADILTSGSDLVEDSFLAHAGALDTSIPMHIIDLSKSDTDLWKLIRRRARSDINNGNDIYDFQCFDYSNFTMEIGDIHRELHHKTAGRVTRPISTFHRSYEFVLQNKAIMLQQSYKGKVVNMTLVMFSKNIAYGFSTADDPEFEPVVPLMHSMMWFIFQECRKRGIKYYEVGDTSFRSKPFHILTKKQLNICYFKRGFDDCSYPFKRWIFFPDKNDENDFYQKELQRYIESI